MAQTLTKPVFLDETGQEIADKLDDIKQAIANISGDFNPLLIKVTTQPTKTSYFIGETLDLTGIVVNLVGTNGAMIDVTSACTFAPADGTTITSQTTSVAISYVYPKDSTTFTATLDITVRELSSIEITTPPTKTSYIAGEDLDLTGMVVTATYNDGTTQIVTSDCTSSPEDGDTLSISDTTVTVSLTVGSTTKTDTQSLTIIGVYGAEWDGTADTKLSRTDSAADFVDPVPSVYNSGEYNEGSSPFDTILPWSGMVQETDNDGNVWVKIPKFYYKWTPNGDKLKLQICTTKIDSTWKCSPAHADRDDSVGERDFIYVARYCCASGTLKSLTGQTPKHSSSYDPIATIHNLGSDIWMYDYAAYMTTWMLYLVEYADWYKANAIGSTSLSSQQGTTYYKTGWTDDIPYHTGLTYANRASSYYPQTQYRGIEDFSYMAVAGIGIRKTGNYSFEVFLWNSPSAYLNDNAGVSVGEATGVLSDSSDAYGHPDKVIGFNTSQNDVFDYVLLPHFKTSGDTSRLYLASTFRSNDSTNTTYIHTCTTNGGAGGIWGFWINPRTTGTPRTWKDEGTYRLMKLPANS